jgi:hypothetical protein
MKATVRDHGDRIESLESSHSALQTDVARMQGRMEKVNA